MSQNQWDRLVEIQRNGITERTIFGSIAFATANQTGLIGADPLVFGRSLMKPFQMKVVARELAAILSWEEKAIACSSHNGTPEHVAVAQSILDPSDWKYLGLPPSSALGGSGSEKTQWLNPCSGKHSAIIKACQINGWPLEDYLHETHPYNMLYKRDLERRLEFRISDRKSAPDGCLLPTYAMKVSELAKLFASLVGERDDDWIWQAHHQFPELIGGTNRLDSQILKLHPNVLAKEGADGLLGLAISDPSYPNGLGIVIKLAHGYDMPIMAQVASAILNDLGLMYPEPPMLPGQQVIISKPPRELWQVPA